MVSHLFRSLNSTAYPLNLVHKGKKRVFGTRVNERYGKNKLVDSPADLHIIALRHGLRYAS
jgi:hypothetical protein